MNELLAQIILNPKLRKIAGLSIEQEDFRFKCTRCAALCCKLGGPVLMKKDVERIKDAGIKETDFLESTSGDGSLGCLSGEMKSRDDGSCVFLEFNVKLNCHKCSIYDFRPLLCRLYPFSFGIKDSKRVVLKIIPCCKGLNSPEGELLDEKFVSSHLLGLLFETVELHKRGIWLF